MSGVLIFLLSVSLLACGQGEQTNAMSNPQVEAMADKLLDAMKAEDYEQVVAQYHESFFKTREPQAWIDELKALRVERGPMQNHILRKSQADTRFSGKFYIMEYESVHDGNKRLHHLITVISPVEGGEMQLIGHKITPWESSN